MSIFLFGVDFLGLLFIIIYVGAIAVLFLFVVMMLDLKQRSTLSHSNFLFWCFFFFGVAIFFLIYSSNLLSIFKGNTSLVVLNMFTVDSFNNTEVLGQCLFNYYLFCFLIAGFILLLALISAVALTQRHNSHQKNQFSCKQLSRTSIFLSFFASNKKI
jgi:NADH-quinone oxidoreductase subunit J